MTQPLTSHQLDWSVNDFARRVDGVGPALVVAAEGLGLAVPEQVDEPVADQLAARMSRPLTPAAPDSSGPPQ